MRREDDGGEKRADGADRPRETLRERKRRETREAIERAAISLVDELGYEGVTVAMICDRAVVSQGTFFNYFPTKDAAIVGIPAAPLDVDAVRAAYDSQASSTPFSVTLALFLEVVRALDRASDIAAMRWRLVSQTPALMRLFLDGTFGFVADFRDLLAEYLAACPDRRACPHELTAAEEADLIVAEALAAAKFALTRATGREEGNLPDNEGVGRIVRKIVG